MYKKIKTSQARKAVRNTVSRFERTPEWQIMKADIDRGIGDLSKGMKPNEVLEVFLTAEDKKRYRIKNGRIIDRFVKEYLKDNGLPYVVKRFNTPDGECIQVRYQPVISQRA